METQERLEVRHSVQRAIALYESAGKEETLSRIGSGKSSLVEGQRFVFALDLDGNLLAHPFSKNLVGRNLTGLVDSEGRAFIKKIITTARNRGYGYTDYFWPLTDSKEELHKTVFFERVDEMVFCSGFYHPHHSNVSSNSKEHYPTDLFELLKYLGA